MREQPLRYVADIEVPEGIVSIDCEVRNGSKTEILFILNRSTCGEYATARGFHSCLENCGEILVETETNNPEGFIRETLLAAYGHLADITLRQTDTD